MKRIEVSVSDKLHNGVVAVDINNSIYIVIKQDR